LLTTCHSINYEYEMELPSGKKWFLSNYNGITNGTGQVIGIQIISADITAQKELEQKTELQRKEQQRLENELYHALRLSNMGQMISELSHEINQPLTAINSLGGACLQILESGSISSPLFYDAIENIVRQSERANQIINGIKLFARKTSGSRSLHSITRLIHDILPLIQLEASRHRVSVRLELDNELSDIMLDPVQIQQVIYNLCQNAIDAMSNQIIRERILTIRGLQNSDTISLSICDTGPGIPEAEKNKIFHAFHTTKPKGLGLGLSISKSIAEAHGGTIRMETCFGQGTTFVIYLPRK